MSDRQKISRKKGNASNISNPSLAAKIPSLATPAHDCASESHQTTPKTVQLKTSEEFEQAAEEQENQENISLKESPLGNFNILERASIFRPQETIQRQELDKQEPSEVVQRRLNTESDEDEQKELSLLSKAFQIQGNQENKLDAPIESFNYLEKASIFRPQETIQSQELDKQEPSEVVQRRLNTESDEDKQEELSPLSLAFQIQGNEENKLDKPIESFNYLERATIFRPQQNVQRQGIEKGEEEQQDNKSEQTKLSVEEEVNRVESPSQNLSPSTTEALNSSQNRDGTALQENTKNQTQTNATAANSGEILQKNQETTSQQPINQEVNQENNATVSETTSQETAFVSPESDPDFQAVVAKASRVASKKKKHAPAGTKAQEAQNAAQSPTSELESKAQSNQVGEMEQAPTPGFNAAAFKAKLMERIKETTPKNLDEADKFKDNNKLGAVKSEMQDKVKQEQTASQTPLEEKAKQPPDTSGIEPKSVTPLPTNEVGAATQNINAQKAVPKPKGQNEIEVPVKQSSQQLTQQMVEANVTEEQLRKSNEPEFQNALAAKQEVNTNANQAPQEYRQFEQNQLNQAKGEASATAGQKLQGMHGDRAQLLSQVTNQQVVAKGSDEQERAKIAGDIQGIYQKTKEKVETTLNGLDSKVQKAFDSGAALAQKDFEDYVDKRMEAYKDERYSGFFGKGRWVKDKFFDLPSEVNVFYEKGRQLYLQKMDAVLDQIVNIIGTALTNAKAEIANGRKKIQQYVTKLPQNLKALGQQAATDIQSQFDELEQSVDSKQDELINNLAQKYNEKLKTVDSRIDEMKAANQGLVNKAANAITGVINTINKLKEMLLSVLSKAAGVIGNIITDPIGFLGNLISGIKQGFENFVGNIWEHLQSGLIGWLTGALGPMGIQMPDDVFSLPGIFSLTTQVLGLTFNFIRGRAVKRFGEPVVAGMEQSVEVFQVLRDRGAMGLWEQVQEQFNDLKETVIEQIKDMVITQVITAGVKWILGLLNPASAFVKAAMAIYDIIMFFVNRGSQVLELVNSIVDAVGAIASGAVGGAAKLVENALSRALPVTIGFLASLLGVSGLAKKVEKIIGSVRQRIDKAIDKVLLKANGLFKGKKGKEDKDEDGKFTEKDRKAGLTAFEKEEKAFVKNGAITQVDARKVGKIVKDKHPVFKSITVVDGKDSWDYKYVFRNDDVDTTSKKAENTEGGTFKLAPGGIEAHEGHKILTGSGKEKDIHLITKHLNIAEVALPERLESMKQLFSDMRNEKIELQRQKIQSNQDKLDTLLSSEEPKKEAKKIKRQAVIQRLKDSISDSTTQIAEYQSIDENSRDAVFNTLDKWKPPRMPTYRTTKFKNRETFKNAAKIAIQNNQAKIDQEFTENDGNSKQNGTSKIIKHQIKDKGVNLGIGYELNDNMQVEKMNTPLRTIVLSLIISAPFEFMIETAYLEP